MSSVSTDVFSAQSELYIDTDEAFVGFIESLAQSEGTRACAIDLEADSMHSYETKLCLIQFAVPEQLVIIDPLALSEKGLAKFPRFVDEFETVWMHGADYDITLFKMTFDWAPRRILDTQIGARFLGAKKFGLANLLEENYGVRVSKQSQKADWSKRPLSEKMRAYAFNDVRYLINLGGKIESQLVDIGRHEWFLEGCDHALKSAFDRDERPARDPWRITGWGKLSPKGLNYLKHLWYWRDRECQRLDRPAFKFLSNQEILRMTENLEKGNDPKPAHYLRANSVRRLRECIEEASGVEQSDYPPKRLRGNGPKLDIDEARFDSIRKVRDQRAASLGLEPTLIATRNQMEMLASTNIPNDEKEELLLGWQRGVLGEVFQ
ncbi:MAG: hypothetical protein AAGA96_15325 [Verrucomicrobiota bacterium]